MANALGEQVCPGRLSALIFGMSAHNTLRDWLKVRDVAYHNNVNGGYALIDIAHSGVDGRDINNATNALLWLKLALGIKVDDVYYERAKAVRARIADLVLNSTLSYSDKVSMVQACFKDLDVQLIHEALTQRFDKPLTYLNESMGDINALLDNKVFHGTTQYAIADIDLDKSITGSIVVPELSTDHGYQTFDSSDANGRPQTTAYTSYGSFLTFSQGAGTLTNTSASTSVVLYDGSGAVPSGTATGDGYVLFHRTGTTQMIARSIAGNNTDVYGQNNPAPWEYVLGPGESLALRDVAGNIQYPMVQAVIGVKVITRPLSISDGDKDHWLRLKDENWSTTLTSRYKALKYYAHTLYDTYKPLIYQRGYMSSKRIRMVDLNVVQGVSSVDDRPVMVHAQTKFTTDFKYIKKDPNGQFLAGGMDRCPAFAGQSSNGIIPDNPNLGHGFILLNQSSVAMNGGINPQGIPFNKTALSSTTGLWSFKVNIPEKIVLPTPSDGTSATTMWDDPTFVSMNPNMYAITNFPMEYRTYVYTSRTRFSGAAQAQKLASTGGYYHSIQTTTYGSSRFLSSTYYQYLNWIDGTTPIMEIVPNMYYFALKNTTTNEWYIPAGYLQLQIANSLDFLTGARSVYNVGGTSPDILTWANQMNSVSRANSFQVRLKFDWSGLYAHVPPTNFDFAETV